MLTNRRLLSGPQDLSAIVQKWINLDCGREEPPEGFEPWA